jgi:hypothetical protein
MDTFSSMESLRKHCELDSWLFWEIFVEEPADAQAIAAEADSLGLRAEWDEDRHVLRVRRACEVAPRVPRQRGRNGQP